MTIDIWFAFVAAAIMFVLLPNPPAQQVATFSLQRGRRTAVATVPALVLGLLTCLIVAMAPVMLVAAYLPGFLDTLAWIGTAYLMIYVIWSLQDRRAGGPVADNDNLPERRGVRIFNHLLTKTMFGPRYVLALGAILVQFVDPAAPLVPQAIVMAQVFAVCSLAGGTIHALFPRFMRSRRRARLSRNSASGKARTVFISRRAVTAGYRRIAA
jgi:threonine/homoserine/homoserine lactone efflux protein